MNPISGKNWRAGASLIAGLLVVIAPYRASGQGPVESPSNIECLERLEMPGYPPLPRHARIQRVQTVRVLLSDEASALTVESSLQGKSTGIEKDFKESAEKALKSSRFSKTCGGKTIMLVFHYELQEDPNQSLFAFAPPNHFWIRAELVYVQPAVSVK